MKAESFPPIDIFCHPRFYKGLIQADGRAPLNKYLPKVTANNCQKIIQEDSLDKGEIGPFEPSDGLIYYFTKFARTKREGYVFKGPKLLICVCMYNESKHAIQTTLKGIYSGLPLLRESGVTEDDIAVVMIQDGILKLVQDKVTRRYTKGADSMVQFYRELDKKEGKDRCYLQQRINTILDEIQNFQRKRLGELVTRNNDFPPSIQKNISFVYQNLWSPNPTDTIKIKLFSCFKHINGTKLSSHLWFFQGFCRQLNPQICILLDVGTKPSPQGPLKFLQAFTDPNVGGVTGFMSIDADFRSQEGQNQKYTKNCITDCLFSVEKAQQFEYIMSHFIDKSYESMLGFLHVLPGAWSGYRYEALIHGQKFEQNLLQRKYFKMLLDPRHEQKDYKQANMYLAEDRILSLGIYCQQDKQFYLKYVPDAIAYTDPMKSHQQLMIQRRRWINSSFFAFMYVFRNYYYNAMESSHNFLRKYILLSISMFMSLLGFINGYFIPTFYLFALYTTIVQSGSNYVIQYAAQILTMIYIFMVILSVVWSLYGDQWVKQAHYLSYIFSFYTYLLLALVIWNVVNVYIQVNYLSFAGSLFENGQTTFVFIITSMIIVLYILIALVHVPTHCKFVFKLIWDSISYMVYQGAYSHVMLIYAFCNVDNVSWGTKGSHGKRVRRYLPQKVTFVCDWLFYNSIAAFILLYIDFFMPRPTKKGLVLLALGAYATAYLSVKVILAVIHQIKWLIFEKGCRSLKIDQLRLKKITKYWLDSLKEYRQAIQDKQNAFVIK